MSDEIYFLNDFQKSTIANKFKNLNIFFKEDDECTCVDVMHPRLPNGGGTVALSASWVCINPYEELQYQMSSFTRYSVEEIIEKIDACVEFWKLYE